LARKEHKGDKVSRVHKELLVLKEHRAPKEDRVARGYPV
jgi:hypothetical protein